MSEMGLGCAKTPALAPHVEISLINCISESQNILHTRGSMPCWRIVFSTFRECMSFYTGRVKLDRVGPSENLIFVRYAPNSDRPRVSYRIVGSAISGPQLTQEPKLLARNSPSRRYRRRRGATSPGATPPQL